MIAAPPVLSSVIERSVDDAASLLPRAAAAIAVFVVAYLLARVLSRAAARLVKKARGTRGSALAPIVRGTVFIALTSVGLATALSQLGINVSALLAGAGVVGLAVGFGAQTLVKDCLTGFFLVMDDVLIEGDDVTIDGVTGVVERVGLRVTQLRSYEGQLWYLPNGEIKRVGNWSRTWVRALVEVAVAYEQDVERGITVLEGVGKAWADEHADLVIDPPVVQAIMGLNGSDVTIRLVVKIKSGKIKAWEAERQLRRRTKEAFDREGVEIPFARTVLYHRQEPQAALRLEGVRIPAKGVEGEAPGS